MNAKLFPIVAALFVATLTTPGPEVAAQEQPMKMMMMGDMDMSAKRRLAYWILRPPPAV
jgi:hypothetical protein